MKTVLNLLILCFLSTQIIAQTYVTQVKPFGKKLWTYANLQGEIIIDGEFQDFYKFSKEGIAAIYDKKKKKFYFINLSGERVEMEMEVDALVTNFKQKGFEDGMLPFRKKDNWGFLNTEGKVAFQPEFKKVTYFNGGYAVGLRGSSWVVLTKGGEMIPVEAKGVKTVKSFTEELAPIHTNDKKQGFIGIDGNIVIPATFKSVGYFSGGLAWVKNEEGKLGYIGKDGEWIIKPKFLAGKRFDPVSGVARVKLEDKWVYINQAGETLNIGGEKVIADFHEGLARGRKGEKIGFFDKDGTWVIEPQFDAVRHFKNGYVAAKKGEKWGFVDTSGNWVIEPKFSTVKDMELVE